MRSILPILTAFVLFGFSFMFSSCKSCDKKEAEPAGRGGDTNNTPLDTTTSNATDGGSSTTSTSNGTPGGSNTDGASDGNSKSTTPSGDNVAELGGKKDGDNVEIGSSGKSDDAGVPALISLEDKIKAVKELVLKVQVVQDSARGLRDEVMVMARNGNDIMAQEKLKALVTASLNAQERALDVENKVRELNIGINPVAIAQIAQANYMVANVAFFVAVGQSGVDEWMAKRRENVKSWLTKNFEWKDGNSIPFHKMVAKVVVGDKLDENDVKAIEKARSARERCILAGTNTDALGCERDKAIKVAEAADPLLAEYLILTCAYIEFIEE
jgi:hypothetical protein